MSNEAKSREMINLNTKQNNEDLVWITKTKRGDSAAFNNIVNKYQQSVTSLCYHMLQDVLEAEDATQEVFIRAYTKLDSYDEQRKFSSWLLAIASHYCLDQLKKPRRYPVSFDDVLSETFPNSNPAVQPEVVLIKNETAQEVRQYLNTLPSVYRTVITLKYWQAMPYQEIAQALNTTVSAIKSNLFRGRRKIAQIAEQEIQTLVAPNQIAPVQLSH
jgi:RNA polymerase sigma-70 factor (ECF subfamily)